MSSSLYIQTGNGVGKTTTALGLAMRSLGHKHKVVMIQFIKGRKDIGEYLIQKKLPNFKVYQFGKPEFINLKNPDKESIKLAEKGLEFTKKILKSKPNLLILDEINLAIYSGLLKLKSVLILLKKVPKDTVVLLTGRYAPKELIKMADFVAESKIIKQPKRWPPAREGIEY